MSEMEKKLEKAMDEDEQLIQDTLAKLTEYSNRRILIKVRDPANTSDYAEVHSRRLRQSELLEYNRRLRAINPKLLTLKDPLDLTDEENQKICDLQDEFIERATGLPREKLKDDISPKIKLAIFVGILKASNPTQEEVADIQKFRDVP